jgi:glycosyltransferase involved in cell wall biosynthesis
MDVLLFTQVLPYPPDSGPKVKTYHVLRYLAERGHQVTLASFVRKHEEPYLQQLNRYCPEIHTVPMRRSLTADALAYSSSLLSGTPFLVKRDAKPEMRQLVRRLTRQHYHIIHADQLTMAQFALQFRHPSIAVRSSPPALVFDAHNAVYEIIERARQTAWPLSRPALALEAGRLRHYEGELIEEFDHTLVVSEVDRRALLNARASLDHRHSKSQASNAQPPITIIPIAVDCERLRPVTRPTDSHNILSVSTLFYPPNADGVRWFRDNVFHLIRHEMPTATLSLVGPRPPKDIVSFGARNSECVEVSGYVPDLRPYLERAALMIVPVRAASGMRVRILEALAQGIPVVTTTKGVEGIDAEDEKHLLVADEPEEFADAVITLLKDKDLGRALARQGRCLVEEKYDWQVVLPKLEALFVSLAQT